MDPVEETGGRSRNQTSQCVIGSHDNNFTKEEDKKQNEQKINIKVTVKIKIKLE